MPRPPILLGTVGTSLFFPSLETRKRDLAEDNAPAPLRSALSPRPTATRTGAPWQTASANCRFAATAGVVLPCVARCRVGRNTPPHWTASGMADACTRVALR